MRITRIVTNSFTNIWMNDPRYPCGIDKPFWMYQKAFIIAFWLGCNNNEHPAFTSNKENLQ